MEIDIRGNGNKVLEMEKVLVITLMEKYMRENTKTIKKMVKEFIIGQIKIGCKYSIKTGNPMEEPSITMLTGECKNEYMRKER